MTPAPRLIAALASAAVAAPAAGVPVGTELIRVELRDGSGLWLEGDSNLRGWSCRAEEMIPEVAVLRPEDGVTAARIEEASLRVPVAGIDCGAGRMNRDLRSSLRASEHPEIAFSVMGVTRSPFDAVPQRGRLDVIAHGRLAVAGVAHDIDMDVVGIDTGDGALRVSGEIDLMM